MRSEQIESLVELAKQQPEHLDELIRCNSRWFNDPAYVGRDFSLAPVLLLAKVLASLEPFEEIFEDVEQALRTGIVQGAANGDDSDEDDEDLDLCWRDDPATAWSLALTSTAKRCRGCVVTPQGYCVGPLHIESWLAIHLPPTLCLIEAQLGAGASSEDAAWLGATREATALTCRIEGGREPALLPRLLLVLHFLGTAAPDTYVAAEAERTRGLAAALNAARQIVEGEPRADAHDVQSLAFIANELVLQEDEARHRVQAASDAPTSAGKDSTSSDEAEAAVWTGDEEPEGSAAEALLSFLVSLGWQ